MRTAEQRVVCNSALTNNLQPAWPRWLLTAPAKSNHHALTHVSMAIESDCWLHPLRLCTALLWPSKMLFHQLLSMLLLRVPMPAAGICQQRHWWSLNGAQIHDHLLCKMKQSNAWGIMSACCYQAATYMMQEVSMHACLCCRWSCLKPMVVTTVLCSA